MGGEEVYDLKAVCKIRDPWPQPWIRIKGQRLLGSQLENKVTDMGLMIDPDADAGGESRGPEVGEEGEAKPLDIAALLAARANKLKGTKVAELDKENEERRKKTLLAMKQSEEESGRIGTMLKKGPVSNGNERPAEQSLTSGTKETTPPVQETSEESEAETPTPEPEPEPVKKTVKEPAKEPKKNDAGAKVVANLNEANSTPTRRRKKQMDDEEDVDPFANVEQKTPPPKEEDKKEESEEESEE